MISIIIPAWNEEKIIAHTVGELKKKLTISHEIIVSDNGSSDRTVELATPLADRVVTSPPGETRHLASLGRNAGARVAKGDILAFFDADFELQNPDEFFKIALERFERDPKLVALTGRVAVLSQYETFADRFFLWWVNAGNRFQNNVLHRGEAMGKLQIMRKSAFEAVKGFREDIATREDGDMFYRLSRVGKTRFEPALVVYNTWRRVHQIGWPRLLWIWTVNSIAFALFDKPVAKVWKDIR